MGGQRRADGVKTVAATAEDLATYDNAQQQLAKLSAPVLLDRQSPNDRLFVAAFDGTGNRPLKDRLKPGSSRLLPGTERHEEIRMDRQKPGRGRPWIQQGPRAAFVLIVLSLWITGCQGMVTATQSQDSQRPRRADNTVADWPFKFVQHNFGIDCYSTYNCSVVYSGLRQGVGAENELLPALDDVHPDALGNALTGQIGIMNFPPPAQVRWRSKDGVQHDVEVDIGEIFKDQRIVHEVPREDIPEGVSILNPDVLLVVQNRTIEVYMRAFIPTKNLQESGNPHSGHRDDLVLAWSRTY